MTDDRQSRGTGSENSRGDRPRRKPYPKDRRDGGPDRRKGRRDDDGGYRKPRGDERKDGERPRRPREGDGRRRDGRSGNGNGRQDRRGRSGRYGDRRDGRQRKEGAHRERPRGPKAAEEKPVKPVEEQKLTIPSTPQKVLFKGIDCETNGRSDLAMVLYLNGAVMLSGGCENNALRMLRNMGSKEFRSARGRAAKSCPDEAMVVFDYLCSTLDDAYDRTFIRECSAAGMPMATYCLIRLEEIEGDDPAIDLFASCVEGNEEMVVGGLKLLVRKKDSRKAKAHLRAIEERGKRRQSIRGTFTKAMRGDQDSVRRMDALSEEFPEARLLRGYLDLQDDDSRTEYLRAAMSEHQGTIVSMSSELGIQDTAFGKFLRAKRLQSNEEEWIKPMVDAFRAGSEEAMDELRPVQNRRDVKAAMASVYLERGEAESLVRCYDGEDAAYLERYCAGDPDRILEVGRLMGGTREIEWLKRGCINGCQECRDALVGISKDEGRGCKQLVYALHDIGADMDAARLYFAMGDDPTLPAVKWLRKVCADDETKEYVRQRFEERGDSATFESIFVDDGYESRRPRGSGRPSGGKGGKGRR